MAMHGFSKRCRSHCEKELTPELSGEWGEGGMMKKKTQSKAKRHKLELQTLAERILKKHNVDYTKDFYLKLSLPPYLDLIMERIFGIIVVGHCRKENGDLISESVLVFSYNRGEWLELGDMVCAYFENGTNLFRCLNFNIMLRHCIVPNCELASNVSDHR